MKPGWLQRIEEGEKPRKSYEKVPTCEACIYFGTPYKQIKHKGRTPTVLYKCALHSVTFNTKFSLVCEDYKLR